MKDSIETDQANIKYFTIDKEVDYEGTMAASVAEQVEQHIREGTSLDEIMVTCRYVDATSHLDSIKRALSDRRIPYQSPGKPYQPSETPDWYDGEFDEDTGVEVLSIHKVKGKEAEHVILLHAIEGDMGFPDLDRGDELLDPVTEPVVDTIEEERRFFYVALTRAKTDILIQTRSGDKSRFLDEIREFTTETDIQLSSETEPERPRDACVAQVVSISKDGGMIEQQSGTLFDGERTLAFTSWTSENPPIVEEGVWYEFENITMQRVNDEPQLVINGDSQLTELQDPPHESDEMTLGDDSA